MVPLHRSLLLTAVALIVSVGILGRADPADAAKQLRWKVKAGEKYQLEMTQTTRQVVTLGEQTVEIPQQIVMYGTWVVDSVDADGTFRITQTIDRVTMTMSAPFTGEVKYDSASNEEPKGLAKTIGDVIQPMLGAKFTQTMDQRGKIHEIKVPNEAFQGLNANPVLKQFFTGDSFKEMFRKASPELPADAIDEGFSWKNSTENKTPLGTMKMDATYTYVGEEQRDARALDKFNVDIKLDFGNGAGPGGAKVRIGEQENSGTFYFDNEAGRIVETTMKQKVKIEVTVADQTVDQHLDNTVKMMLKPVRQ